MYFLCMAAYKEWQKAFQEAEEYLQRAIELATSLGLLDIQWRAQWVLTGLYRELGKPDLFQKSLETAHNLSAQILQNTHQPGNRQSLLAVINAFSAN